MKSFFGFQGRLYVNEKNIKAKLKINMGTCSENLSEKNHPLLEIPSLFTTPDLSRRFIKFKKIRLGSNLLLSLIYGSGFRI